MIYFFFPETAGLTLEEIAKNFGEEVAVHVTDATDEEKARLEREVADNSHISSPPNESDTADAEKEDHRS